MPILPADDEDLRGPFAKKIAETEAMKDLPALAFSALDMTAINDAQWPQKPSEAAFSPPDQRVVGAARLRALLAGRDRR